MLHRNLDLPSHVARRTANQPIIKTLDVPARNNLSQSPILRIPHLHKILIEQQHEPAHHRRRPSMPYKLHNHAPRDIPMLVHIHRALLINEQELRFAEAEHPQGLLALQPLRNHLHMGRLQIGDTDGLFLIEREDLKPPLRADGKTRVEDINPHALGRDVELIKVPKELRFAAPNGREARLLFRRLLEHGLENL